MMAGDELAKAEALVGKAVKAEAKDQRKGSLDIVVAMQRKMP